MPQSPSKQAPWDLTQFSQHLFYCSKHSAKYFGGIASALMTYFPESYQWSEISSLSKVILVLLKASSFWNPQISFQFSHCQSLIFVDCSSYVFNIFKCSAYYRPSRTWITLNRFSTIFEASVPHFYLHFIHCTIPESLLNSFHRGMFKLIIKFDADQLLYSFSHFECDSHTVHMLT